MISVHKDKIIDMKVDVNRGLLYSAGADKRICVTDIKEQKIQTFIKVSNMNAKCLAIDYDLNRLYVGTEEGLLVLINVSQS